MAADISCVNSWWTNQWTDRVVCAGKKGNESIKFAASNSDRCLSLTYVHALAHTRYRSSWIMKRVKLGETMSNTTRHHIITANYFIWPIIKIILKTCTTSWTAWIDSSSCEINSYTGKGFRYQKRCRNTEIDAGSLDNCKDSDIDYNFIECTSSKEWLLDLTVEHILLSSKVVQRRFSPHFRKPLWVAKCSAGIKFEWSAK